MAKDSSVGKNIAIVVLILIILGLLARYVVFREQFEEWGAGLERIGQWRDDYKAENPDATKEQIDDQFRISMDALQKWETEYREDHPGATDAEIKAAFDAAWGNK